MFIDPKTAVLIVKFDSKGVMDFNCSTNDVSFEQLRANLIKLKIEIERQLDNQEQCPFSGKDNNA